METLNISTITPVYAGSQYLEELMDSIVKQREKWKNDAYHLSLKEAIFVVDDAIDDSIIILQKLALKYEWVRVINLSRNFGQHPATIAGILYSSGDWIVTLDEDLQHPPQYIDDLLFKVAETDCDIVYAKPTTSVHRSVFRNYSSKLYKYFLSKISGEKIGFFNSYRLIRGSIARATASVCSHETYFDVALLWFTQRVEQIDMPIKDDRNINGTASTYTFSKLISHAGRMIVSTRAKILRVGMILGILTVTFAMGYTIFVVINKIIAPEVISIEGWASLIVCVLFFGGVITLLVSIILEYIAVILLHIQGKPTFFVVDRSNDSVLKNIFLDK